MNAMIDTKHALLLERAGGGLAAELVMGLLTTARRIDAECAALLEPHGLSEGRFAALLAISAEPGAAPARIAERLGVTRATVTGLVDGLARAGWAVREPDPSDRRALILRSTSAGEALLAELAPRYGTWLQRLTDGIGSDTATVCADALTAIQRNAEATA